MIETAILLAAGAGSRLRSIAPIKPLCPIGGRTLLSQAIHGLATAGIKHVVVVIGFRAEEVERYLRAQAWPLTVETVTTDDHSRPNGCSVLSAEQLIAGQEAVLAMCDHLVDPKLYRLIAKAGAGGGARLAVDRHLNNSRVDLEDVTRVETRGDCIVAIGKSLTRYDAYDTGVFAIGARLFEALRYLETPSLTDGMQRLANAGAASAVDCRRLAWIDVDDEPALKLAEELILTIDKASGERGIEGLACMRSAKDNIRSE